MYKCVTKIHNLWAIFGPKLKNIKIIYKTLNVLYVKLMFVLLSTNKTNMFEVHLDSRIATMNNKSGDALTEKYLYGENN